MNILSKSRKGQAAIEYLMNYAWAIALIIIVGIAIFALDVGGLRTSLTAQSSRGFQLGEDLAIEGWTYTSDTDGNGTLSFAVRNHGANRIVWHNITITEVNGVTGLTALCNGDDATLHPGTRDTCTTSTDAITSPTVSVGSSATITARVYYEDDEASLEYAQDRELTTTAQTG